MHYFKQFKCLYMCTHFLYNRVQKNLVKQDKYDGHGINYRVYLSAAIKEGCIGILAIVEQRYLLFISSCEGG